MTSRRGQGIARRVDCRQFRRGYPMPSPLPCGLNIRRRRNSISQNIQTNAVPRPTTTIKNINVNAGAVSMINIPYRANGVSANPISAGRCVLTEPKPCPGPAWRPRQLRTKRSLCVTSPVLRDLAPKPRRASTSDPHRSQVNSKTTSERWRGNFAHFCATVRRISSRGKCS
jgi:hypothetical protein